MSGGRVLLLVPGYNGAGEGMLSHSWMSFADANGLVLLAPTFHATPEELHAGKGYYYPSKGSGEAIEKAIDEVSRRVSGLSTSRILIFGFSAGAHVAHRFALWKPAHVEAFVAVSAAWWDKPTRAIAGVPALIMCGEDDPRFSVTEAFFEEGTELGAPWVWRSYQHAGHQVTPAMLALAQAFLRHYSRAEKDAVTYGDAQTYEITRDPEQIPEIARVRLPSAEFAHLWQKEN
jgi:predicted esterase